MTPPKIENVFIELLVDNQGVIINVSGGIFLIQEFEIGTSIFDPCPFLFGTLESLPVKEILLIEGMVIKSSEIEYNIDLELFKFEKGISILIHDRTTIYKTVNQLNQNRNDMFFLKREISEKNKQLEILRKEADKANEEKTRFLAMMSHEVRNPLNVILGYTEMINKEETSGKIQEYLKYLTISGKNLKVIVDDILDLSRVEAGKLQLSNDPINLEAIIAQIENNYKSSHRDIDIELLFTCGSNLPKYVLGDDVRIYQILTNLINNSIKFTQHGSVTTNVDVIALKESNASISFKVTDTGRGMSAKQAASVFEEYTQNELNDNRIHKGAGLGLSIVKRLVSAMNGTISVQSKVGVGTVFQVDIPFQIDNSIILEEDSDKPDDKNYIEGSKILVADDNFLNRTIVEHILKKEKADFTLVKDGVEAVGAMDDVNFDVVLLDINMPNLTGEELMYHKENYEKRNSKTPFLALTANSSKEDVEGYYKLGFSGFIPKPFTSSQFTNTLNKVLKNLKNSTLNNE